MEAVIILGLLIVIIILITLRGTLENKINILTNKVEALREDVKRLSSEKAKPIEPLKKEETIVPQRKEEPISPIKKEEPIAPIEIKIPEAKQQPIPVPTPKAEQKPIPPVAQPRPAQPRPVAKPKEKQPSFFEQHPDLEKFIGENLINKIGIGILVIGIGFFVKYAIDKDWINEIGRVFIGILCGGILVGLAHRLRKNFKAFSSVLVGGGLAVFYFTIYIAFHDYQIFSQTAAFIIMVIITAFAVLLSLTYDRKELAVLAIIGGFASPIMVSTGEGNYIVLFSYVSILNLGMLILAYFKKWNLINIISFAFTAILFGGWLVSRVKDNPEAPYAGALFFATLFYLIFFVMNIINNIKENRKFIATEISLLLSNTFLYYSAGMIILANIQEGVFQGLFTASIAIFNFGFAFVLYKNKKVDLNLVYLLIGLVLTFLSLAAPIQLKGNHITLFWSAEAVLLLWLSQKAGIKLIKIGSIAVMGLMIISLVMDWNNIYFISPSLYPDSANLTIIFNKGFITSIISVTSILLSMLLLKKEEIMFLQDFKEFYKVFLSFAFGILLYVAGLLELTYQLNKYIEPAQLRTVIIGSYNLFFLLGIIIYTTNKKSMGLKIASIIMGVMGTLAFMTYYHISILELRGKYLFENLVSFAGFSYHYILTAITVFILILSYKNINSMFGIRSTGGRFFLWYLSLVVIFISSAELDHIILIANYSPGLSAEHIISQNHKIGYPILWGICSFILMTIGMRSKIKDLRIISLSLFLIIILKLFIIDIREVSEGGKIAAFICLGVLLLVISFMYQKLKKLVLDDENKMETQKI